jgi:phage-related protein
VFKIDFYEKENGKSPVRDYLDSLEKKSLKSKDARIKLQKITAHIDALSEQGTMIGEPVTKHLHKEIWELRPLRDRILYFYFNDNKFVLLHHFIKQTSKTPKKEIEQAIINMADYINRKG